MMRHRAGEGDRRAVGHLVHGQVIRPSGDARVDGAEAEERPCEQAELERSRTGEPGRAHERRVLVGDERVVEDRVVALGGPHPQHVPGLLDAVARCVTREERVDDLRLRRVARVHGVHTEVVPDRRQAAEDLVAGDLPTTGDPLGLARRQEDGDVVAALTVAGGEDLARRRLTQHPLAARVAEAVQVGGDAGPVDVHVHRDRGGGRDGGQPALQLHHVVDAEPQPTELARDRHGEVPGRAQLLEGLLEEAVLAVVHRRALVEASEHVVGEHAVDRWRNCGCRHGMASKGGGLSHRTVGMSAGTVCRRSVSRPRPARARRGGGPRLPTRAARPGSARRRRARAPCRCRPVPNRARPGRRASVPPRSRPPGDG